MQAQIHTVAFRGIETIDVTVQIHLGNGLPAMTIVGLADKAVASAPDRVRFRWRIMACCFLTNWPSLRAQRLIRCASPLKPARWLWHGPIIM
jgi:hypothetical protein